MIYSLLCTLAAYATPSSDSAFDSFSSSVNPAQGSLGDWSYGYYEPGDSFALLPNMIPNTAVKLHQWQI